MSSEAPGPRPSQVTIGGWAIAIASAMLVVTVFDAMASLHSVDTRDTLTRALTTGSAKELGISVADALALMRVALYVAGLGAVVTGILGIFVLQRHAAARIVLTVAAVPVVLTAPFSGGFLPMVIGGSTALLWTRPARDWFRDGPSSLGTSSTQGSAGRAPARPETARPVVRPVAPVDDRRHAPAPLRGGTPWPPPAGPPSAQPPPTPGWGQPLPSVRVAEPPALFGRPVAAPLPRVPTPVRVACILTWVFSLLTALIYLLVGSALVVDRTGTLGLLRDNPAIRDRSINDDDLVSVVIAASVVIVVWCLASCVLAILAWRRHTWAWVLLMVSIGFATAAELISLPYSLLHLAAAVAALRMLLAPRTRAWFRDDRRGPSEVRPPEAGGWAPPDPGSLQRPQQAAPPPEQPSGKPPVW